MAAAENDQIQSILSERAFWTQLKEKLNKVPPQIDTIIRLRDAYEASVGKDLNPYKKCEFQCIDHELELIDGCEYRIREDGKIYAANVGAGSSVKPGSVFAAVDDEALEFGSVEEFMEKLQELHEADEEVVWEFKQPFENTVKLFRKRKKLAEDAEIDWPAFEAWFYEKQTPEAKMNRLTPKKEKLRDDAINECAEVLAELQESEIKEAVQQMLTRFSEPFTRDDLAEYNFTIKRVVGKIQRMERQLLAEIKEAKASLRA